MKITVERIKEIIKEEYGKVREHTEREEIIVPGIAAYDWDTLQSNIVGKCGDLVARAARGEFTGIGDNEFEVLSRMWKSMKETQERKEEELA